MHLRALEQIGDGRKPDMGMRPHIDPFSRCEIDRAEIVEEHEWPDRALVGMRQHPRDTEPVAEFPFDPVQIAHRTLRRTAVNPTRSK